MRHTPWPNGVLDCRPTYLTQGRCRCREKSTAFDKGNFKRAFFIYHEELAPLGDKYAQYMVGFMYVTGLGVDEDPILGSAWYRIAAERDTPEFVAVRDRLMRVFTDQQKRRSDALFAKLRLTFSDTAVLISSISDDIKTLQSRTGSRVGGETSSVAVISAGSNSQRSTVDYYGMVERRLAIRLQRLARIDGFEDIDTDPRTVNVRVLKRRAAEKLRSNTN